MPKEFAIEADKVRAFIEENVAGFAQAEVDVTRHPGGHSCETWNVTCNGEQWILRRPPRGNVQKGASDMRREYRVIRALWDTPVPVPRTIALCEDPELIGAPFLLMERVDGVVLRHEFPEDFEDTPERRKALGETLVDVLAEIHKVDWREVGLQNHGRPDGFLARNLSLMKRQWDKVQQRPVKAIEAVGAWLEAHIPEQQPPTIIHGDYKLDNVMWNRSKLATISAVLDWEISTIADPLVDVGWLRGFWCDEGDSRGFMSMGPAIPYTGGFLSRDEIIERWAEKTGRDIGPVPWFEAFGMWKIAIIMEASYSRYLAGQANDPMFATLDVVVPALADAALAALQEARLL